MTNPQGGGKPGGGGGGPTSTPAPPQKKWYDAVPRHHGKRGVTHVPDEEMRRDTIKVNPRWTEAKGPHGSNDYKNNCTRVSATWILRTFFGWDVTAGEAPWKDPQKGWQNNTVRKYNGQTVVGGDWYNDDILEKWIDPNTGQQRDKTTIPTKIADPTAPNGERDMTHDEWYDLTKKTILDNNPEGSGGLMRITGHIFNWMIQDGKVRFIEAQPQPYPWEESYTKWDKDSKDWWRTAVSPDDDGGNWFMRVDDMEPSKKLFDKKWVFVVTKGEKDAPFFEDMVAKSYALYADSVDKREAFRTGWDQVRRGRKPRMPNGWGGTEKEAAYRAGVEYGRKPD